LHQGSQTRSIKWDTAQYAQTKNAATGLGYINMTAKRGHLCAQNAGVTSTSDKELKKL
jgi:hypothetical protein